MHKYHLFLWVKLSSEHKIFMRNFTSCCMYVFSMNLLLEQWREMWGNRRLDIRDFYLISTLLARPFSQNCYYITTNCCFTSCDIDFINQFWLRQSWCANFNHFLFFWFLFILGPPYSGSGATIRIGQEIRCLPFAGFLC